MPDGPAWTTEVVAYLLHPTEAAVWQPAGESPALTFMRDGALYPTLVGIVNDEVRERWGVDAITLRCVSHGVDRETGRRWQAYLLCPRSPDFLPEGEWRAIEDLSPDALPESPTRADALAALRSVGEPASPHRRPWASRGWFNHAVGWAERTLDEAGIQRLAPAQQFSVWSLSSVIKFDTSAGAYYFKAAICPGVDGASDALLFANEAALTGVLARAFPDHIAHPVAVDRERVWLITPDIGATLDEDLSLEVVEAALRLHARHQRMWAGRVPELLEAGCVDRRLPHLRSEIDAALDDERLLRFLEPDERLRLQAARPVLRAAVDELATLGIPDSLVHGDLHIANVARRGDTLTFFDWTDGAVACPFLDFISLGEDRDVREQFPDATDRLITAYIDEWEGVAPRPALERALALCRTLGFVYQAASFRHISATLEGPEHEGLAEGGASFLKQLDKRLRESPVT